MVAHTAAEVATTLSWLWINLLHRTLRFPSTAQWLNIVTMSICITKASHRPTLPSQTWFCNIEAPLRCKASIMSFVQKFLLSLFNQFLRLSENYSELIKVSRSVIPFDAGKDYCMNWSFSDDQRTSTRLLPSHRIIVFRTESHGRNFFCHSLRH